MEILWEFYCNHCQQPDHSEDAFGQLPCPIVKTFVLVISLNIRSYFLWISGHDFFEYQITISLNIRSWFLCNEMLDHRSLGALWWDQCHCPAALPCGQNFIFVQLMSLNIISCLLYIMWWILDHDLFEYQIMISLNISRPIVKTFYVLVGFLNMRSKCKRGSFKTN